MQLLQLHLLTVTIAVDRDGRGGDEDLLRRGDGSRLHLLVELLDERGSQVALWNAERLHDERVRRNEPVVALICPFAVLHEDRDEHHVRDELRRHDDLLVHSRDLIQDGVDRSLCRWRCTTDLPHPCP